MAILTVWFRSLGNAGARANAARACRDRRQAEETIETTLLRVMAAELRPPAVSAQAS